MKTLKFSILCIVLAFVYCNADAQKPIVPNNGEYFWTIDPANYDLPCLTEPIGGILYYVGFFTNSSQGQEVHNWNYQEKAWGTLKGLTSGTGIYEASYVYNAKGMSFKNGKDDLEFGGTHNNVTKDGKLFITINFNFRFKYDGDGNPIVERYVDNVRCK